MSSQTFSTFSEVGMIDARSQNGIITLPLSTDIPYRILTLKDIYGAAAVSSITLTTQGADTFEDGTTSRLLNGAFETTTLYAGQAGFWYVTGGSRLATAAIGSLSTGLIQNPLRLGTVSTQTAIQFPGLRSNYTGTVVAGQTTGVGTQELLLYQASSISDQIRLQTTGNIVFEAGAGSRSWPSTAALVTPTLYIAGTTSNVGIGTNNPLTTLDVVGAGRFQTLSSVSLNVSSINGIIPGAAFIGSTNFISATTVQALTISAQSINVSSVNGILPGAAFNGSTLSLSTGSVYASNVTMSGALNMNTNSINNAGTISESILVTNLVLWLDAADTSTLYQTTNFTTPVTTTGQSVGLWKDKSLSANSAVAVGTKPTTNFTEINGKAAITLPGNTSSYFQLTANLIPGGSSDSTYFFVIKNGNSLEDIFFGGNLWLLVNGTGIGVRSATNVGGYFASGITPTSAAYIITVTYSSSSLVTTFYSNGSSAQTQTINSATASTAYIGTNGLGNAYASAGTFCEIIIYNNVLGTTSRQQTEAYLANKWGITLNANNPYYTNPAVNALVPSPAGTLTQFGSFGLDTANNLQISATNAIRLTSAVEIPTTLTASSFTVSSINGQTFGAPIQSTVVGLGTAGYISSAQLTSTVRGLAFTGSTLGLSAGTIGVSTINIVTLSSAQGYISSFRTDSLTVGGPTGYVAIQDLTTATISTGQIVAGAGFISSLQINTLSFGPSGYVIVGDVIANSLSTKRLNTQALYTNNLYLGNTSTQSAILFPGVDGNFKGTAVAEQVTGVGTGELLLYKVSTTSDQIRLQTTGNIVFEAGAAARSWPSTTQLATPTLYIQGSTSNVGVGTAAPATTLDVVGTGRFLILSSYTLNVSSINGILPGAAFNGSTVGLSTASVLTSSLNANAITTTNLTVNGAETVNFNGGSNPISYGSGLDTLSLKSPLAQFNSGIASLFFGNGTAGYPLARLSAVDQGTTYARSALIFQTATPAVNSNSSGTSQFQYTGANQSFTVPAGVTTISVELWGAGGGHAAGSGSGGAGAYLTGNLTVIPGGTYAIIVGQAGQNGSTATTYGGGGAGNAYGSSGGGRSAVQYVLPVVITTASATGSVISYTTSGAHGLFVGAIVVITNLNTLAFNVTGLVASFGTNTFTINNTATGSAVTGGSGIINQELVNVGGGGGGGYQGPNELGGYGAYIGTAGAGQTTLSLSPGQGGTQSAGGAGGSGAPSGGLLYGAASGINGAGGGGGGYYAGGTGGNVAAGGGGSSYTSNPLFTLVSGANSPNLSTQAPATGISSYVAGVAVGGASGAGGPGLVVISAPVSYSLAETMRIANTGSVGIATANPQALLHVSGMTYSIAMSTQDISVSSVNGSTLTQLVRQPLQSTVAGLGTAGYVSTQQLAATSNFFQNLLALNVSSAISTATLYTSNTSNYFLPALSNNLSSAASTLATFTSNTSNYFQNLLALNVSSAISTATLFTSNTSNFILSTNQSSFSTAYLTANQGYISSLIVDSLAIGSNAGFINMGDIIATSLSTLQLNTGLLTASEITVSSINGQQPLTLQNLTSTVSGTNSNISSMIDPTELTSTVTGLGTANFISTVGLTTILASTVIGVNTTIAAMIDPVELASSITGLGTTGFISSIGLDARFASTTQGLGTVGYLSSSQLLSTVQGLGAAGYASTSYVLQQISSFSTAMGRLSATFTGSTIFLSAATIQASNISTFQITAQNITSQALSTNALIFGTGTGTLLMPDIAPNTVYTSTVTTSNLQVGWTSNQSPIQFYGFGTYSNSVIVEQSTGTTTQELFVFRGSNAADRIRFQTTGYMAIETGVSSRLYTAALSNAVPTVMIDINSNVGIRLAAPAVPLDVGGTIRAPTLSSLTLQTSTIEGAIFTRDLFANARTLLQGEVSTSFLLGNYNTLTFRTAGIQRATFTQAGNLGIGIAAPQFPVDIAGITRVSTIFNSTSISYNFISAPLLVASTVNTENVQANSISTNQINASLIYGRWNDAQYYVLQTL